MTQKRITEYCNDPALRSAQIGQALAHLIEPQYFLPEQVTGHQESAAFRLLDPRCGSGAALHHLASALALNTGSEFATYGVSGSTVRPAEVFVQNRLRGEIGRNYVAAGMFSMLYLHPNPGPAPAQPATQTRLNARPQEATQPADSADFQNSAMARLLNAATPALQPGGLLVLTAGPEEVYECADLLADAYEEPQVWAAADWEQDPQLIYIAYRKTEREHDTPARREVRRLAQSRPQTLTRESASQASEAAYIHLAIKGEVMFHPASSELAAALARMTLQSGAWLKQEPLQLFSSPEALQVQLLMPARRGQMAQMAAAGLLDNLTLTDGETRVIIKGRSVKRHTLQTDEPEQQVWRDQVKTTITILNLDDGTIQEVQ